MTGEAGKVSPDLAHPCHGQSHIPVFGSKRTSHVDTFFKPLAACGYALPAPVSVGCLQSCSSCHHGQTGKLRPSENQPGRLAGCRQISGQHPYPGRRSAHDADGEGQTEFPCPERGCTEVCPDDVRLRRHIRIVHHNGRYRCKHFATCGKDYTNASALSQHLFSFHGEKRIQCPVSGW